MLVFSVILSGLLAAACAALWWLACEWRRIGCNEAAEWRAEAQRLAALNRAQAFERMRDLQALLAAIEALPEPDKAGRALEAPAPESIQ